MQTPIIIGIFGKKNAGKSTLARQLLDVFTNIQMHAQVELPWIVSSFAQPIKLMLSNMLRLSPTDIDILKNHPEVVPPKLNYNVRTCLQKLGQLGREMSPTLWIDCLFQTKQPTLIDDGRYINEADAVVERGGTLIYVERVSTDLGSTDTHPSETEPPQVFLKYRQSMIHVRNIYATVADYTKYIECIIIPEILTAIQVKR